MQLQGIQTNSQGAVSAVFDFCVHFDGHDIFEGFSSWIHLRIQLLKWDTAVDVLGAQRA